MLAAILKLIHFQTCNTSISYLFLAVTYAILHLACLQLISSLTAPFFGLQIYY